MQRSRAVMLRDEVGDLLRQSDLFRESRAVRHVTRDDLRALVRTQAIVRIVALLVFDEILRRCEFADVVIKRADTREQGIGADGATRVLSELSDGVRVLIRSRRAQCELATGRSAFDNSSSLTSVRIPKNDSLIGKPTGGEDRRQQSARNAAADRHQNCFPRQRLLRVGDQANAITTFTPPTSRPARVTDCRSR